MFDIFKKINTKTLDVDEFNIICPKCMVRMDKVMRGNIILDVCTICGGTWFDKDEIEKLFLHIKNEETSKNNISLEKQESVNLKLKKTNSKKK